MPVLDTTIEVESQERYLTYALSVVSGRALPDVRDGLKPVQRRILYAMYQNLKLAPPSGHRKSATVVGEVLGRYHPHGDTACYEAMVRMAQSFSLNHTLVDGEGNFGSLDGDNAAAYRYTEARLTKIAVDVIGEIDEETVNFRDNFDSTTHEPVVFPSRVPNLLINGASGIAVGMATSIPPHNLRDVCKALIEILKNPEIEIPELVGIIKAPDFPTACSVINSKRELNEIYKTGRGTVRMRGDWELEEGDRGKKFIVISSIPYTVNKAQLVEKIANLILERKIPQLNDVRDESTDKVRVVLELTAGADAELAMAYLYKNTPIETGFVVNLTALTPIDSSSSIKPELLSLKQILQHFIDFRRQVIQRKLTFEKKKLLERIHILEGLAIIFDHLDEAIKIIRKSEGRTDGAEKLQKRFKLSEIQSYAIVDMRLYQLSRTSIDEILDELKAKTKRVNEIEATLKSKKAIDKMVEDDLNKVANEYGVNRRSKLISGDAEIEFNAEAYIVQEDVFAIVTKDGWIKRIRQTNELETTRIREGDSILSAHPLNTLDSVALFTNLGNYYVLKVQQFPSSSGYGEPIQKVLKFADGEAVILSYGVKAETSTSNDSSGSSRQGELFDKNDNPVVSNYNNFLKKDDELVLISESGKGFGLKVDSVEPTKRNGKRVMKVKDDDKMAAICFLDKNIAMFTKSGMGLVIQSKEIPVREGSSVGISLMGVNDDDKLISAVSFGNKAKINLILESGTNKEIQSSELFAGHRALKGKRVVSKGGLKSASKI